MFKIKYESKDIIVCEGKKANYKGEEIEVILKKQDLNGRQNVWYVIIVGSDLWGRELNDEYNPIIEYFNPRSLEIEYADEWVLEATQENAEKIIKEIERRFFPNKESIVENLIKSAGVNAPIERLPKVKNVLKGYVSSHHYDIEEVHIIDYEVDKVYYGGKVEGFLKPEESMIEVANTLKNREVKKTIVPNWRRLYIFI